MLMISRRSLRSLCSWLYAGGPDDAGNPLEINTDDAARLHVATGDRVTVRSRTGGITVPVAVTDVVPPGVVSMQFGFAPTARQTGGKAEQTMNVLVDAHEDCDRLTGMPTLNGIPVRVEATGGGNS